MNQQPNTRHWVQGLCKQGRAWHIVESYYWAKNWCANAPQGVGCCCSSFESLKECIKAEDNSASTAKAQVSESLNNMFEFRLLIKPCTQTISGEWAWVADLVEVGLSRVRLVITVALTERDRTFSVAIYGMWNGFLCRHVVVCRVACWSLVWSSLETICCALCSCLVLVNIIQLLPLLVFGSSACLFCNYLWFVCFCMPLELYASLFLTFMFFPLADGL